MKYLGHSCGQGYGNRNLSQPEPEIDKRATGLRWKRKAARMFKFVDDGMIACKINMNSGRLTGETCAGKPCREKHCLLSQNLFRRVVSKAESRGMVVNNKKTTVLCISGAINSKSQAFLLDADNNKIRSTDKMKVLGFHMDSRPSCHAHVAALRTRMRDTIWVLRHLRMAGFTEAELATVYKTVICPIVDYCCVVYHSMLTDEQDQQIERLQSQAL